MSDVTPASSDLGSGPIIVHVDASFEPLIPKFIANRKKEITTMTEALDQGDFEMVRKGGSRHEGGQRQLRLSGHDRRRHST